MLTTILLFLLLPVLATVRVILFYQLIII